MKQDERLWQEMAALVRSDPGMRQALVRLVNAKRIYESERERRCDGKGFFCD